IERPASPCLAGSRAGGMVQSAARARRDGAGREEGWARPMRGDGPRGGGSAWTVARLQRIGNWGRADEALGRRWEEVGLAALATLLGQTRPLGARTYAPRAILAL